MCFVVASDIHGSALWCKRLIETFNRTGAERLILLGDILYHGPRNDLPDRYSPKDVIPMLNGIADKIICIKGNCDSEVDQMVLDFPIMSESAFICAFGQRAFASHGHVFNPDNLPPLADGDIFLYGHTHIPDDKTITSNQNKKVRCINPGSVSIPKNGTLHRCLLWDESGFNEIILDKE